MKQKTGEPLPYGEVKAGLALLASIVEYSNDAIISTDPNGNITSWNPAAERMYGYSAQEIIGQNVLLIVLPESQQQINELRMKVLDGHQIEYFETTRIRKDGSEFPVSLTLSPIRDFTGAIIGTSSISRDMTEQNRASKNANRMASIIKSSNDAIHSVSLDGIIDSWNPAAEKMYGYSAEEMIGQSISIIYHPDSPYRFTDIIDKLRTSSLVNNFEILRVRKDGSTMYAALTASPIFDAAGVIIGVASISRDLTELKKLETQTMLLAAIVTTSSDAITSFTLDGIRTSWNLGAERMFGYSAEEMIGQPFSAIVPSGDADEVVDISGNIRRGETITNHETVRLRKDGSAVPVSINISPIHDLTGALIGASVITRDITGLKKAEQKFRVILESSPDAMVIVDKTGTIAIVNSQTEKIFGYRRDEMLGQPVELLIPSRFHANYSSYLNRIFADPHAQSMRTVSEFYGRRKDGREFPAEINLGPIETADGILVAATIRDATDHRHLIRRLEEMNELRNEFVAVVAHDIRSPMTSISGFAHELTDQWEVIDDNQKIEYLHIITRNTDHLARFVEDVLQVTRIEAGEFAYDIHPFDIRSLTQRVLDETAGVSDERRFEFIAPEDFPLVLGDEERLWQVLTNVLSNAVKFSTAEEPITVGLSCTDDSVQVAVTDRGIGIAKDDLPKLFVKFGRVSQLGARKVPGNGLGLYICKTLVEAQGGRIWCESSPGQGSTFFFTIPVAP